MRRLTAFTAAFALVAGIGAAVPAIASQDGGMMAGFEAALAMDNRAEDRARDQYRNPAETLAFFRVEPGMTVVDYMPASGWYTRVLAPYLGTEGQYIGINPLPENANNDRFREYAGQLNDRFTAAMSGWNLTGAPVSVFADQQSLEAMNGQVDRVLIIREMHNLHRNGLLHSELGRLHGLLSDDGMLGLVQHRAKPWAASDYANGSRGYMRQQDVIGLVEAHGFQLVGTSEVNANPMDTADHERGVWEMPPSLATEREELSGLGESDRMTLLFRKR